MRLSHNCRIKTYPDGSVSLLAASRPFGGGEYSPRREDAPLRPPHGPEADSEGAYSALERVAIQDDGPDPSWGLSAEANRRRAQRRARVAVKDLGLCNPWKYFVTLTLDRRKVDRYDAAAVVRHLNRWLDNQVRRHGLAYVLVPEHHKDGAIHFHGFFNDAISGVDSGHRDAGGHTIYNLPAWSWGFSTAIELYGERRAAVGYVCKYVTKQQDRIGGRWYYSGGALRRPVVEWCDVDFQRLSAGREMFAVDGLPETRFVAMDFAHKNLVSNALGIQESCERLTISGLSPAVCGVDAATGEAVELSKMTQEKFEDEGVAHDNGIPFESGDSARFGGADEAKRADRRDGFTHGASGVGRAGAQDGAIEAVYVGDGEKDREAPPMRPALGPFTSYRRAGRACVGVPRREAGDPQDPAGGLERYQTRIPGFPFASERWDT